MGHLHHNSWSISICFWVSKHQPKCGKILSHPTNSGLRIFVAWRSGHLEISSHRFGGHFISTLRRFHETSQVGESLGGHLCRLLCFLQASTGNHEHSKNDQKTNPTSRPKKCWNAAKKATTNWKKKPIKKPQNCENNNEKTAQHLNLFKQEWPFHLFRIYIPCKQQKTNPCCIFLIHLSN